jgi:hypothetical protein
MNHENNFYENQFPEFTVRTAYLINRYIFRRITELEHDELDQWVAASFTNQQIFELLTENMIRTGNKKEFSE